MRTPFLLALRRACAETPNFAAAAAAKSRQQQQRKQTLFASAGKELMGGGGGGGGAAGAWEDNPGKSWNNGEPTMFLNKATKVFQCRDFFRPHFHVSLRGAPSMGEPWTLLDVTNGPDIPRGHGSGPSIHTTTINGALTRLFYRSPPLKQHVLPPVKPSVVTKTCSSRRPQHGRLPLSTRHTGFEPP